MTDPYTFPELIAIKQSKGVLSQDQIEWFVKEVSSGNAHDAQIGAMLMAIFLQGMNTEETAALTRCMKESGDVMSWPEEWKHLVVDKHSTGGVGDKISLVLAPALAACGLKVPMISGRSLGHTGGTLDKLESIPGFNVNLSSQDMVSVLENVGCCIVGQTSKLVPADKQLYAIRDITSTVASSPLIVSSIISKKAAEGLTCLVLDVKYGLGSFQETVEDGKKLAYLLAATSQAQGIKTTAFVTDMNEPLGNTIGNSLEVIESVECLQGKGPADIIELVTCQGGELLRLNGLVKSFEEGKKKITEVLSNEQALSKFKAMMVAQGVTVDVAERCCKAPWEILPVSANTTHLTVPTSGVVTGIDALCCAKVSAALGAGRSKPGDTVTHDTGLLSKVSCGDVVKAGDVWVTVYHKNNKMPLELKAKLDGALRVEDNSSKREEGKSKVHSIVRDV